MNKPPQLVMFHYDFVCCNYREEIMGLNLRASDELLVVVAVGTFEDGGEEGDDGSTDEEEIGDVPVVQNKNTSNDYKISYKNVKGKI